MRDLDRGARVEWHAHACGTRVVEQGVLFRLRVCVRERERQRDEDNRQRGQGGEIALVEIGITFFIILWKSSLFPAAFSAI